MHLVWKMGIMKTAGNAQKEKKRGGGVINSPYGVSTHTEHEISEVLERLHEILPAAPA